MALPDAKIPETSERSTNDSSSPKSSLNDSPSTRTAITTTTIKPYGKIKLTSETYLLPEEKLVATPSSVDGLDQDTETDLRTASCNLIQTAGILLKLPQVAIASAQVMFQRFYYSKSFLRYDARTAAMACIYLSGKAEENVRHLVHVINVFHHVDQVTNQKIITPLLDSRKYAEIEKQILKAEARILKELGFSVKMKNPLTLVVIYLQAIGYEENKALVQKSWNYMNDSLRTDAFIRHKAEIIACACIYLGARFLKVALPNNPAWFMIFKATKAEIKEVAKRILRLYDRPIVQLEELEKKVEELRKRNEEQRAKNKVQVQKSPESYTPSPPQPVSQCWGGFVMRKAAQEEKVVEKNQSVTKSDKNEDSTRHRRRKDSRNRSRSKSRSRNSRRSPSRRRYRSRSRSRDRRYHGKSSHKHRSSRYHRR